MIIVELVDCQVPTCVEAGDTKHRWEWEGPTVHEMIHLQELLGMDLDEWEAALNEGAKRTPQSLRASIGLVNVLHRRIGRPVGFDETEFNVYKLGFLLDPSMVPDPAGKDTPTSPLPDGGPASTSGPSTKAGSGRKSPRTRRTSGDPSASP